jgi:hypothetical protein
MNPDIEQLYDQLNEALGEILAVQNRIPDEDPPDGLETARESLGRAATKLELALAHPMFEDDV